MNSTTQAALQLFLTRGLGVKKLGAVLDAVVATHASLEEVVAWPAAELADRFALKPEVAGNVVQMEDAARSCAEMLEEQGIHVLVKHQEGYPAHLVRVLDKTAPPVLFAHGRLSILERKAVGFGGSRHASPTGITLTGKMAGALGRSEINIVSGGAAGVDMAAHLGALKNGGTTTLVLAEGIQRFRPKGDLADQMSDGSVLVLSEFPPQARWEAYQAMHRNRTVCGLSQAFVLIESGMEGGTFNAGETAMELGVPLFVVAYAEPPASAVGNQHFLKRGAVGLRPDASGDIDSSVIVKTLHREASLAASMCEDGRLFADVEPLLRRKPVRKKVI